MKEPEYRLYKNRFRCDIMSLSEADKTMNDYRRFSWKERLAIAAYLNSISYNYPLNDPPKMEK